MLISLLVIFILVILSAFFSSSETALTSLSRAKLHKLAQKGYKKAHHVTKLREDKDLLISNILVGNNIVNILASALATKFFLDLYGDKGVLYATIMMTALIIIFAEILPKTYALYNAEKVSLFVSSLLRFFNKILTPLSIIAQFFVNLILALLRIEKSGYKDDLISAIEELRGSIELKHHDGSIHKHDKDMLDSILDLAETEVSCAMTHRKNMLTINADDDSNKILETISKSPYTRVPLWKEEEDNIVGVVHAKDILKTIIYSTKNLEEINFLKICAKPWFIPESTTLREQLIAFKKRRNHFAIVVDEYGTVMGVITLEDILEEIVGEIKDEHDKGAVNSYKDLGGGVFLIDGDASVRDINRDLDFDLPEEDASTVAGLLINACEKIPERDEKFEFFGFNFHVVERHKNQLTRIKVIKLKSEN